MEILPVLAKYIYIRPLNFIFQKMTTCLAETRRS